MIFQCLSIRSLKECVNDIEFRSNCPKLPDQEAEFRSYWDVLQTPLQPLSHNLEYATYEVFEADSVKYIQYEKAIISCLIDLDKRSVLQKDDKNGDQSDQDGFIVMVLGAGRGPLVSAALRAQKSSGIKIRLFAIEKVRSLPLSLCFFGGLDSLSLSMWIPFHLEPSRCGHITGKEQKRME